MLHRGIDTLSTAIVEPETRAEGEHLLTRYAAKENVANWDKLRDSLIEWAAHRDADDEGDGLEWPSRPLLTSAYCLSRDLRDANFPAPSDIVPNGEGGIAFEWHVGPYFTKLELGKDGSWEFLAFDHGKLACRRRLP